MADEPSAPDFFATLVTVLSEPVGVEPTLQEIADQTARLVPARWVATLVAPRLTSQQASLAATTDPCVTDVIARAAAEAGASPGLHAFNEGEVCHVPDVCSDLRYPAYAARLVAQTAVRCVLSIPLIGPDGVVGVTTMYGDRPNAFGEHELVRAELLASLACVAIAKATATDKASNLLRALETNRTIGVAVGILVERFRVTEQEAFELLRSSSQNSNRKLVDLAQDLVSTGQLHDVEAALERIRRPT